MKKQLIFLMLFFILKLGTAQDPLSFPTQNATWSVQTYNYSNDITVPDACITRHYGYSGDTLIDGNVYGKLYGNNLWIDFPYEDTGFNLPTAKYVAAVRTDSTRKVWLRPKDETIDKLYYDFGLSLDDTFCFEYFGGQCEEVALVDSILIDGIWRKQIYFNSSNGETWVDGIGSLTGWFEWQYTGTIGHSLNCFQEMNSLIYDNGVGCHCDTYTSIQNFYWRKGLKISPNPTTGKLNIEIPFNNMDTFICTLYSIFGKKIKEEIFTEKSFLMDLNDLENGIYLLSITDSKSNFFTKKIIKTKK